jgi:hypothetical protein
MDPRTRVLLDQLYRLVCSIEGVLAELLGYEQRPPRSERRARRYESAGVVE